MESRTSAVPFKTKAACRHHIPKQQHRVTNWAAYDAGLRARGSLTVWFTAEAIEAWKAEPRTGRDRADTAGCASPMYCRARPHGLAEGVGVQLACSDRGR